MQEEEWMAKRLRELAQKCYQCNQYTFTGFLPLADVSLFYEMKRELSYVPYTVFGGMEGAERVIIRFGSREQLGYEEAFPIACISISPVAEKFAGELTHRDYLGALMNLGMERSVLGDILIKDKKAYLFCMESMKDFIMENLTRVGHTTVHCLLVEEPPRLEKTDLQEIKLQVSSGRLDGIIARLYKLSRSQAAELFFQKRVFVNGRLCENSSHNLKEKDVVSVRGYGKFEFQGGMGVSKKGKLNLSVLSYGKR